MPELSKIKEFSSLVSLAAKLGKKEVKLTYLQSVELMQEINELLLMATSKTQAKTMEKPQNITGGGFKN